ncbi:MAG: ABC transporter ATP-binding protein [Minwuiales bacterium]|nr:ABC transporter ATP-binding protein [Minwuiales bacterium]
MSEQPILRVSDLCTFYGSSQALFDVGFSAPRRGAVAVLGRNGAGKTTLLKTIAGELRPQKGEVEIDGRPATRLPTEKRIRAGLGYVPQEQAVFGRLSVLDNLMIGAMSNRDKAAVDRVLQIFPKLADRLGQHAGTLSGGERKMLAIGRALLGEPKLLLLDEPTEGVWIGVIEEIVDRLSELARDIGLVIVEQHLDLALRVSDFAYVLDRGRVALSGSSDDVRNDPQLLRLLAP